MYLDYVPLLSKGDFALYYGGVKIIPLLSDKSGSLVNPVFMGSSLVFQLSFLIFKRLRLLKLTPKTTNSDTYFSIVYNTLLSGFSNTFTIIAIVIFTASGLSFTLVHYERIEERRKEKLETTKEEDLEKIPFSIYLIAAVFFCLNIAQFLRNYALRKFAQKKVKEFCQVNFRKDIQRKSNRILPTIIHTETQPEEPSDPVETNSDNEKDPKPEASRKAYNEMEENRKISNYEKILTQMKSVELPEVDI